MGFDCNVKDFSWMLQTCISGDTGALEQTFWGGLKDFQNRLEKKSVKNNAAVADPLLGWSDAPTTWRGPSPIFCDSLKC